MTCWNAERSKFHIRMNLEKLMHPIGIVVAAVAVRDEQKSIVTWNMLNATCKLETIQRQCRAWTVQEINDLSLESGRSRCSCCCCCILVAVPAIAAI